ncbi:hypothetical protein KTO58_16760 [Chitinophaga pendula]|uniref:HD domain-containing protein n=1 Tax=Chitinophaga TaxID=79328 RepID=UPI000BAFD63E|nr:MULTISPECIES: hypothetical protein [Chitinophaga]ASZ11645.1 hypothetical protein CK934_12085 [Chitinophaga sp. MD30]UCJ05342.1 hypothetical protein KTO58_16760 [Chitinophaga pendula]
MNNHSNLQPCWQQLTARYTADQHFSNTTFQDIIRHYSEPHRQYHTLSHISRLLQLTQQYQHLIADPDTLTFAVFFHDLIYDIQRTDNEALSAAAAIRFLHCIRYPETLMQKTAAFINATKSHINDTNNPDLDLFLDIDLSILGEHPDTYRHYTSQIRHEYAAYPDETYSKGRKKILQHLLDHPTIYKTPTFRQTHESQARINIQTELSSL